MLVRKLLATSIILADGDASSQYAGCTISLDMSTGVKLWEMILLGDGTPHHHDICRVHQGRIEQTSSSSTSIQLSDLKKNKLGGIRMRVCIMSHFEKGLHLYSKFEAFLSVSSARSLDEHSWWNYSCIEIANCLCGRSRKNA